MRPAPHEQALRPLRLGIVGFGRLAQGYYAPALRRMNGIQAILVADPLDSCRALARESLRAQTYAAPGELLAQRLDALLVASPPSTHLEIWNDACRAALPVFMEKPFVLNGELARVDGSPAARRLLMIDFSRRFWPVYGRLRDLVRNGVVGAPHFAEFTLHVDVAAWCTVTSHRLSPREGGVLYDLGSQTLDLVSHVFDADPSSIEAETSSRRWDSDHVRLQLWFPSGLRTICDLAYGDRTCERVAIWGPQGRLCLNDPNMTIHLERGPSRARSALARGKDLVLLAYRGVRRSRSMARHSIRAALAAFLRAVRQGDEFSPGFEDAAKNTMWLEAASRLARSGGQHAAATTRAETVTP
jgi:predicted dehydrogenase